MKESDIKKLGIKLAQNMQDPEKKETAMRALSVNSNQSMDVSSTKDIGIKFAQDMQKKYGVTPYQKPVANTQTVKPQVNINAPVMNTQPVNKPVTQPVARPVIDPLDEDALRMNMANNRTEPPALTKGVSYVAKNLYNNIVKPAGQAIDRQYEKLDDYNFGEKALYDAYRIAQENKQNVWDEETLRLQRLKNDYDKLLSYMTPEQKVQYSRLPENKKKDYLDSIMAQLQTSKGAARAEEIRNIQDKTNQNLQKIGLSFESGMGGFKTGLKGAYNLMRGADETVAKNASEYAFDELRPETKGALGVAMDLSNTVGNMAPSIGLGLVGGPLGVGALGTAAMGVSSAGKGYDSAIGEGYTPEQAAAYGVASGISEALLQKIAGALPGVSNAKGLVTRFLGKYGDDVLSKVVSNPSLRKALVTLLGNAASEGSEEGAQEIIDTFIRNAVLGEDNNINWKDVGYSALLGGMTGGAFALPGGVSTVVNRDSSIDTAQPAPETTQPTPEAVENTADAVQNDAEVTEENTAAETEPVVKVEEEVIESKPITDAVKRTVKAVNPNAENSQQIYRQIMTNNGFGELVSKIDDVAGKLGIELKYYADNTNSEGYYENGVVGLNINNLRNTEDGIWKVFKHELTHFIEGTEGYGKLSRNYGLSQMFTDYYNKGNYSFTDREGNELTGYAAFKEILKERYAKNGVNLTPAQIQQEAFAKFIEDSELFTNEDSIRRLAVENPNLIQKIYRWIKDTIAKIGATPETRRLMELEKIYERALGQAARGEFKYQKDGGRQNLFVKGSEDQYRLMDVMEQKGMSREEIWKETGLIRDTKGNVITEINDKDAKFYPNGDLTFRKDHPEYARYEDLYSKLLYGDLSESELAEFKELGEIWGRERERLKERFKRGNAKLGDVFEHDKLYEIMPELADVPIRYVEDLGALGERSSKGISLSSELDASLREAVTLHEVQHELQHKENRPAGANPEYWQQRINNGETFGKYDRQIEKAEQERQIAWEKMPAEAKEKVREINREMIKARETGDFDKVSALEDAMYNSEYADLYEDYASAQWELEMYTSDNKPLTANQLYMDTGGEIEARQTENRRKLTDEERRNKVPDLGWDKARFVYNRSNDKEKLIKTDGNKNVAFLNGLKISKNKGENFNGAIRRYFNDNFKNKEIDIIENGELVTTDQIGKYLYPGEVITNYDVKRKSVPILDEIIKVATNKKHSSDLIVNGIKKNHAGLDASNGWDYYDTMFVIDDNSNIIWGGVVIVRNSKNGKSYFYDLDKIREVGYQDVNEFNPVNYGLTSLNNNIITDSEQSGKKEFSFSEDKLLTKKAESYLHRNTNTLLNDFLEITETDKFADVRTLKRDINTFAEASVRNGEVDRAEAEKLFDTLYRYALKVNTDVYDKYRPIAEQIKNTKLYGGGLGSLEGEYRRKYFNKVRLVTDPSATKIDSYYKELSENYPELFDPEIVNIEEQVPAMAEAIDYIYNRETKLSDLVKNIDERYNVAKEEFMKSLDRFEQGIEDVIRYNNAKEAKAEAREALKAERNETAEKILTDKEFSKSFFKDYTAATRAYDKLTRKVMLTPDDTNIMRQLSEGTISWDEVERRSDEFNIDAIKKVYDAYNAKHKFESIEKELKAKVTGEYRSEAEDLIENSDAWEDKPMGAMYSRETMERNIEDITKKGNNNNRRNEDAYWINKTYFKPVHENEAKSTRLKNELGAKVKALNLGTKPMYTVMIENEYTGTPVQTEVSESGLVQLYGEGLIDDNTLERLGADKEKIHKAVNEFRGIYNQLIEMANETLIRNGYRPVEYRKDYFPHFTENKPDSTLGKVAAYFGIEMRADELPTDIAGITHTFRPGKKWVGNFLERKTNVTDYDALKGFDRYINGAADVIFHTDDIQRLRALESALRYKYSDEGTRKRIKEIEDSTTLTPEEKNSRIEDIIKTKEISHLPHLVTEIRNYTDNLAGKKSISDRNWEHGMGRGLYNFTKKMENRVSANMVALNPGSWLTNFIPITQVSGIVDPKKLARAIWDTSKGAAKTDGFRDRSDFLVNRKGSEMTFKTTTDKIQDTLTKPFGWIDSYTAEIVTRALYYDKMAEVKNEAEALEYANEMAARVMADRSKGAKPTAFNAQNPVAKLFTMFQVEVNNQYSYMFKDVPADLRKKGLASLAWAFVKMFLGAYLYNEVYEKYIGRRPGFDPIDIMASAINDFTNPDVKKAQAVANTAADVVDELPFVGGIFGGGRVPISSAFPDPWNTIEAGIGLLNGEMNSKKAAQQLGKELIKPAVYLVPPVGGGQIKKAYEAREVLKNGGEVTYDNEGNEKLKYSIEGKVTFPKMIQGALFGKSSFDEYKNYYNNGRPTLSVKQTQNYHKAVEAGINYKQYMAALKASKGAESDKDKDGKTIALSLAKNKKAAIDEAVKEFNLTKKQKELLYEANDVSNKVW